MGNRGLTLIEMLITLSILGILAAIALPAYHGYERGAARQEATTNLQGLAMCLQQYYADNNQYTPAVDTTYTWQMNSSGQITQHTLTDWLTCFKPQAAAGSVNNYEYTVKSITATDFTATAIPVNGPVVGDANLAINDAGIKNGPWPQ